MANKSDLTPIVNNTGERAKRFTMGISKRLLVKLAEQNRGPSVERQPHGGQLVRYIPLILMGVAAVVLSLRVPCFLTAGNIINVLVQSSSLGLMAIGMTVVYILGGMDLSIPSVMALSAIIGAMFMRGGGNPVLAAVIMLAVGTIAGSINGFAVAYLRMIPFVVTLSMMAICEGTAVWITNATSVTGVSPSFTDTILAKVFGVPVPVIILAVATIVAQVFVLKSLHGRWLYAVGTNVRAARVSGIPTERVIFGSYVFSGFFAGLAGIVMTARFASASATMGQSSVVLDIMSSAVVGGVSIYGGAGTALGAVVGAIFITLISNAMNLLQISFYMTLVVKGCVIVAVVALDSLRRR